jgi:hypothetical protein
MSGDGQRTRWKRALLAGGLAAVLPKCLVCVAGYTALATGLATTSPELCGAVTEKANIHLWGSGIATGVITVGLVWLKKQGGARPLDAL